MNAIDPRAPLLPNLSQYQVDFVIPRAGVDVPLGIDPFLLFKSRDSEFLELHKVLLDAFNAGIAAVRRGDLTSARRMFDFPEVAAIGLGYTRKSKRGSGVGTYLTELILETLAGSPALQERGVHHVEEMQLLSAGVGPDRISDIAANLLKRFLIEYTQRQCAIWNLPAKSTPISHIYDPSAQAWEDSYEELPVSPVDGSPILLVPRRFVRALPWINYDDFLRTEFNPYLAARREVLSRSKRNTRVLGGGEQGASEPTAKQDVVTITRGDIGLVERYARSREQHRADARPALDYIDDDACREAELLKAKLGNVVPGRESAGQYQRTVLEILNYLFNPDLIDGQPEVRTIDGTERRDIIFTNDSDESFWEYVRSAHDGILLMFEAKNTEDLDLDAVNQTATYLGDRIGRLGVIVTRKTPTLAITRKIFSVWNDSSPNRKVILTLSDAELHDLLDLRGQGDSPTKWMQAHYRKFRTSVQ
jgi:hypothetical protein